MTSRLYALNDQSARRLQSECVGAGSTGHWPSPPFSPLASANGLNGGEGPLQSRTRYSNQCLSADQPGPASDLVHRGD